jgi:hypothetical protein
VAQHKGHCNNSNATVVAMVTALAAATTTATVVAAVAKTMVATVMAGGTDNNQLKVAAEETAVAVTETGMATETVTRMHS